MERERRAHRADAGLSRRRFVHSGLQLMLAWPALFAATASCGSGDERGASPSRASGSRPDPPAPAAPSPEPDTRAPGAPAASAGEPAAPPAPSPAAGDAAAGGDAELATEIPSNQAILQALQYTHQSPKPDQSCVNCRFYVEQSESRGRCQIIPAGLVKAGGWCSSWQAKA